MSAETIAAEIAKAVEDLRTLDGTTLWVHYVNKHGVAVKRRIDIHDERVDGAALILASGQVAA